MTTPQPNEITEEIRQAVRRMDCDDQGHQFDFQPALGGSWGHSMQIGGQKGRHPYIRCSRCDRVWLVVEESAVNYDDAVVQHKEKLKNPGDFNPKPPKAKPIP